MFYFQPETGVCGLPPNIHHSGEGRNPEATGLENEPINTGLNPVDAANPISTWLIHFGDYDSDEILVKVAISA